MFFSPFFSRLSRVLAEGKSPRRPAFTAALILFPWLFLQLTLFRPYYLVNDDILKIMMAKGFGTGGAPSDFFEGSNVLLGMFFKGLFSLFPNEPWFGWFLYGLQALALWGFLWAELSRPKPWWRIFLFLAAMEGVYFLFFIYLQFNIVAILSAQSGLWLLAASFESEERGPKRAMAFFSCAFFWITSILRPEALFLGMLLVVPLLFPGSGIHFQEVKKPFYRRLLFSAGALIALSYLFHSVQISRSVEWREFYAFHQEADGLNEYRSAEYNPETKPFFQKIGWSSNDLWLFKNWFWMDTEKFSTEKLRFLNGKFLRWSLGAKYGSYSSWGELLVSPWDLRILFWALALAFFCQPGRLGTLLSALGTVILLLGLLLYGLKATDRVTLPVLAFLVTTAVHFAQFPSGGRLDRRSALGLFLLACLGFNSFQEIRSYHSQNLERRGIEAKFGDRLQAMKPLGDRLIVHWDMPLEVFNAFDDLERFRPFHFFLMSSSQRSPAQADLLKEYGLEEFGKGLVDNPRVLVNCSAEQGAHLAVYLQEKYGIRVHPQKVYECEYFKVFALHS